MPIIAAFSRNILATAFSFFVLLILSPVQHHLLLAQEPAQNLMLIEGTVVDKQSGEPVNAASVRVQGMNRGTYTDKNGKFRLPLPKGSYKALVRSLGFEAQEIALDAEAAAKPLRIELLPATVKLGAVDVVAEVSAKEIVRRAIQQKDANRAKVRSTTGLVYSKTTMEIAVPKLLPMLLSKEMKTRLEQMKNVQLETYTRVQKQYTPTVYSRKTILQRRQTANVPADANTLILDEFFDFSDEQMNLNGTRLVTPLGAKALDSYNFWVQERKQFGDRIVYVIGFKPYSEVFPGFEGAVQIIDGNYSIVQISASPTAKTAIKYLDHVSFFQKFERFNNKSGSGEEAEVWLPTLLEGAYRFNVEVLSGVAEVGLSLKTKSIVSELDVNSALPANFAPAKATVKASDRTQSSQSFGVRFGSSSGGRRSIKPAPSPNTPSPNTPSSNAQSTNAQAKITSDNELGLVEVAPGADSVDNNFWNNNALTELTSEEQETYRVVDSVMKAMPRDTTKPRPGRVNPFALVEFRLASNAVVSLLPAFNQTRVTGWLYGAQALVQWEAPGEYDTFGASLLAAGVMNLHYGIFFGDAALRLDLAKWDAGVLSLTGEIFSQMNSLQQRRFLGERFNRLPFGNILYQHFLDYYRQEGFGTSLTVNSGRFEAALGAQQYGITNLPLVWTNERVNIPAEASSYQVLQAEAAWNMPTSTLFLATASFMDEPQTTLSGRIMGRLGRNTSNNAVFGSVEARAEFLQPTFYTGYAPMFLRLTANVGYASANAPLQEQFIAFRRLAVAGRAFDFATLPVNGLADTEYWALHAEHNCSDMLWRLLNLPTWKGRGIDFVLLASAGQYRQQGTMPVPRVGEYGEQAFSPSDGIHAEVGLGISRIPSFISDFLNFRVDLLWGLGKNVLPGNNFGFSITCSLPF